MTRIDRCETDLRVSRRYASERLLAVIERTANSDFVRHHGSDAFGLAFVGHPLRRLTHSRLGTSTDQPPRREQTSAIAASGII